MCDVPTWELVNPCVWSMTVAHFLSGRLVRFSTSLLCLSVLHVAGQCRTREEESGRSKKRERERERERERGVVDRQWRVSATQLRRICSMCTILYSQTHVKIHFYSHLLSWHVQAHAAIVLAESMFPYNAILCSA